MPFSITHLPSESKLCQRLCWPILEQFYPRELLWQHVQTYVRKANRVRKLTVLLVLQVLICWTLLRTQTLNAVYRQLSSAERWLAEEDPQALPTRAAWTRARASRSGCTCCASASERSVSPWRLSRPEGPLPSACA